MFFDDHNPPHFHAFYGEFKVAIDIARLTVFSGSLPPRALGLVIEWATLHQKDLLADWVLAEKQQALEKIEPLQ
jgi:hypothetical protein